MDILLLHIKPILAYAFGYNLLSWLVPLGWGADWVAGACWVPALGTIWWPGTVYLNGYYVNTM